MALSDVVNSKITRETQTISRQGYGVPMLVAYHTVFLERAREYNGTGGLAAMVADGFAASSSAYRMAASLLAQNPKVKKFKVGRRVGAATQKFRITPINVEVGYVYSYTFESPAGVETVTYTNDASPTVAEAVTALATAIDAIAGLAAVAGGSNAYVDVTIDTAGDMWEITDCPDPADATLLCTTTNPATTIQTDLAAILAYDPDWYGLAIDSGGPAEITAAAVWAESNKKLFAYESGDTAIFSSVSTSDIAYTLQASSYAYTFGIARKNGAGGFGGCAMLGKVLTYTPGSYTLKFKTLSGFSSGELTASEKSAAKTKRINTLDYNARVWYVAEGVTASGEYVDVTHGTDALNSAIQERVFGMLLRRPKLAYTAEGIEAIRVEVESALKGAQKTEFIAPDIVPSTPSEAPIPAFVVEAPDIRDVDDNDKAARALADIQWQATLAGAIHTVSIAGRLTL
jgi:hypothetical protein